MSNLLPLLNKATKPRILSILNGTKEKKIDLEDLGLEKHWSIWGVVNHTTVLTSLAFDHLAANNGKKQLTLIHDTPGFVHTGTPRTSYPSKKDGLFWWAFVTVMQNVSGWIIVYFGMRVKESGERHAYYLTSDTFHPGSWRADRHNEVVPDNSTLSELKEAGWAQKIWDHTLGIWDKALSKGVTQPSE